MRSTGLWVTTGGFPAQLVSLNFGLELPLTLPGPQIQYMSAGPSPLWSSAYSEFDPASGSPWGGQFENTFRVLPAGPRTIEWNRFPLHPQPDVNLVHGSDAAVFPVMAAASRAGNTLTLSVLPFGDNQPGHLGAGFVAGPGAKVTGSYAIYRNGIRIARGIRPAESARSRSARSRR
ncbi:MAG TPA: hypothetical protein VN840_11040 [Streptosporangiaceae bacterium]|nr:hypothetical protein [Streptosporangiaceae bacterium]